MSGIGSASRNIVGGTGLSYTHTQPTGPTALMPLQQSTIGGSGSFLVLADDQRRYWCKCVDGDQGPRVPANEQIVGRLGKLLGVAVCEVSLVLIPEDLAGWEFRPGKQLAAGWAHGSLSVESVTETRSLDHRANDDNRRRHAGFYALRDWLGGSDDQWLVAAPMHNAYFSHDHGHYFGGDPNWTPASLGSSRDQNYSMATPSTGLDMAELLRCADELEGLAPSRLEDALASLPTQWNVSDADMEAVIDFADYRRPTVAARLRAMAVTP